MFNTNKTLTLITTVSITIGLVFGGLSLTKIMESKKAMALSTDGQSSMIEPDPCPEYV